MPSRLLALILLATAATAAHGERCQQRGARCTFKPEPATPRKTKPGTGVVTGHLFSTFHSGVPGGHDSTTDHACAVEVHDAKDKLVTTVSSDAKGLYSTELRPGRYWIDVEACFKCDPGQPELEIVKDAAVRLDVYCEFFGK
jgi:hypothetical protein